MDQVIQPSRYARPDESPALAETVGDTFKALAQAAEECELASQMFLEARTRWTNAQAQLAEAQDRIARSREQMGV